jgi:ribonuclease Z
METVVYCDPTRTSGSAMEPEINESTKLAADGGGPLTATPIVGTPSHASAPQYIPGAEQLASDEIRVTVLGSGDPFVKKSQAAGSLLIEVGNAEQDFFFFDLGSGVLANFTGLGLPVTATTKVFLTHLHADHVGDMPTLLWSFAKAGRRDPVEVWGPAGDTDALGTRAYCEHLEAAHAWDTRSMSGHPGQSGARAIVTEVPYDRPKVVYERNGVTIRSFPVIHIQNGAVGYRLDYAGRSVVFSGDTRPCRTVVDASEGADLLIHETFPTAAVLSEKSGMPLATAEAVVNGTHTSPTMVGRVFKHAGARMSAMWHLVVDHETIGPVFGDMRTEYDGPVTICQDLTVFNVTDDAIVVRQAVIDPYRWPVVGPTVETGPPMNPPLAPPAWWADALLD